MQGIAPSKWKTFYKNVFKEIAAETFTCTEWLLTKGSTFRGIIKTIEEFLDTYKNDHP